MSSTNKFRLQRSDPFLILNLFDVARFHIYLSCSSLLLQKGAFTYQSRNFLKCNGLYLTDNCMNGMKYQSTVCYISFLVFFWHIQLLVLHANVKLRMKNSSRSSQGYVMKKTLFSWDSCCQQLHFFLNQYSICFVFIFDSQNFYFRFYIRNKGFNLILTKNNVLF